jgi:hypothetical protein
VVELRTNESRFLLDAPARIVWLQRAATVNDQVFDSYALYTDQAPLRLMTSRLDMNEQARSEIGTDSDTDEIGKAQGTILKS